jgi:hypothetical protein
LRGQDLTPIPDPSIPTPIPADPAQKVPVNLRFV